MNATHETHPARSRRARNALIALVGLLVVFLIGAGWQAARAAELQRELDRTKRELEFTRLEATLGAATLEAQRGSFEVARQLASDFYSGLQSRIADTPDPARRHFTTVLDRRDEVITDLSRSLENVGLVLSDLYLTWRSGMAELARAEGWTPPEGGT